MKLLVAVLLVYAQEELVDGTSREGKEGLNLPWEPMVQVSAKLNPQRGEKHYSAEELDRIEPSDEYHLIRESNISVAGESEDNDFNKGYQLGDMEQLLGRRKPCRSMGGRCLRWSLSCQEGYQESKGGRPYCTSYKRRCCYPGTTPVTAQTTAATTTEPPECPKDMFLFGPSNGRQCFKYFGDSKRTWAAANQKCRDENLVLAEPKEPISLRAYIVANYNPSAWTWLGCRGDGSSMRWVRSGAALSNTSPLWWPGRPGSYVTTADNLRLLTTQSKLDSHPTKPYHANQGRYAIYTLCEMVMN